MGGKHLNESTVGGGRPDNNDSINTSVSGGVENRPQNIYVMLL